MLFDAQFWLALLQIIGVNIILSGDNAVVIALACRSLPPRQQTLGIAFGAGAAVVLRVILTVFVVYLMTIPYLNVIGGLLLLWIGYKLMTSEDEEANVESGSNLWAAVRIVVIADAVMSLDNVIAVAAAARGSTLLLIIGLLISVPLVVYGATLLIKLIKRYPAIIPAGAALIGYVGGEIIVNDIAVRPWVDAHAHWMHDWIPLLGAVGIVVVGRIASAIGAHGVSEPDHAAADRRRPLSAHAPMIVIFLLSLFGYAVDSKLAGDLVLSEGSAAALHGAKPLLAAIIAVALGSVLGWMLSRRRQAAVL